MSDIKVIEVKEFEPKKCDLSGKEMEEYNAWKKEFNKRFFDLCDELDRLRTFEDEHHIRWSENKQMIADAYCILLQMTDNAGKGNHVAKMQYEKLPNGDEIIYPILADGNSNWYTAHVSGDSGTGMIVDITNQFVRKAW